MVGGELFFSFRFFVRRSFFFFFFPLPSLLLSLLLCLSLSLTSSVWMSYSIMKLQNMRTTRKMAVSSCDRRERPGKGKIEEEKELRGGGGIVFGVLGGEKEMMECL